MFVYHIQFELRHQYLLPSSTSTKHYLILPRDIFSLLPETIGYSSKELQPNSSTIIFDVSDMNNNNSTTNDSSVNISSTVIDSIELEKEKEKEGNNYLPFVVGHTELCSGILHLFRSTKDEPSVSASASTSASSLSSVLQDTNTGKVSAMFSLVDKELNYRLRYSFGTVLCVLAVPGYMSVADFFAMIGDDFKAAISHARCIRDSQLSRYMILLKFRSKKKAKEFQSRFHGRQFNMLEPEICHVVYVQSIEFKTSVTLSASSFFMLDFPDTSQIMTTTSTPSGSTLPITSLTSTTTESLPPIHGVELPTCPVCLERLDANISGVLTIQCNHSFHCNCLSKWSDNSCPVCRFTQTSSLPPNATNLPHQCSVCQSKDNLWICLICGKIGCGRYQRGHAKEHFQLTGHSYSLDLESQRIWDYAGDGYVHRLIQSRADGNIVEFPEAAGLTVAASATTSGRPRTPLTDQDKHTALFEYEALLNAQLDSQRLFFETEISNIHCEYTQKIESLLAATAVKESEFAKMLQEQHDFYEHELSELDKDKAQIHKELKIAKNFIKSLTYELSEEKDMSKQILANQESFKQQLATKDTEIAELSEQMKDLLFHLESQNRVEQSGIKEEIQEGSIIITKSTDRKKKSKK